MRNNVVKKVLAATLACMMTFSMTTVAQAKGDKSSDKEITIGVTSFADTLEPTEQYFSCVSELIVDHVPRKSWRK